MIPLLRIRYLLLPLLVALAACGAGAERPAIDDWADMWERARVAVPDQAGAEALNREGCDVVLERLRNLRPELTPAPVSRLDDIVEEWLAVAEETFFECPPNKGERIGFEAAYRDLTAIEAEVDVVGLLESAPGDS